MKIRIVKRTTWGRGWFGRKKVVGEDFRLQVFHSGEWREIAVVEESVEVEIFSRTAFGSEEG